MPASERAHALIDLLTEFGRALRSFRAKDAYHRPAPPAAGLVLDVGAGHAPHPRADVVVDKYVADDFERNTTLSIEKPIIVGDGHALPLDDGVFSYVIASHVLEHATDPVAFASELARVGGAGFVQVPSRESEVTFGWPFHPWLIDEEDGTLVFHPRDSAVAPIGPFFHTAAANDRLFGLWFGAHREIWHHTLHWHGAIPVRVEGESRAPQTAVLDVERTLGTLPKMQARGPEGALREALRCPKDRGTLVEQGGRLVCRTCERSYPVAGSVPVLLEEAAR